MHKSVDDIYAECASKGVAWAKSAAESADPSDMENAPVIRRWLHEREINEVEEREARDRAHNLALLEAARLSAQASKDAALAARASARWTMWAAIAAAASAVIPLLQAFHVLPRL